MTIVEGLLSASLLFGVFVNLKGARGFLMDPAGAAIQLGLPVQSDAAPTESANALILLRLVGVCLIALAMFYLVTALGPLQQTWNVVLAILARITGFIFYTMVLSRTGGPAQFRKYRMINIGLAVVHGLLLALTDGGLSALQSDFCSFSVIQMLGS